MILNRRQISKKFKYMFNGRLLKSRSFFYCLWTVCLIYTLLIIKKYFNNYLNPLTGYENVDLSAFTADINSVEYHSPSKQDFPLFQDEVDLWSKELSFDKEKCKKPFQVSPTIRMTGQFLTFNTLKEKQKAPVILLHDHNIILTRFTDGLGPCRITTNPADLNIADMVVFTGPPPAKVKRTSSNQIWLYFSEERPDKLVPVSKVHNNAFNWTAVLKYDSTIPVFIGLFVPFRYPECIHNLESDAKYILPELSKYMPYLHKNRKSQAIALVITKELYESPWYAYVKELQKHITVDIYGYKNKECKGTMIPAYTLGEECEAFIANNYRFYLALDPSGCENFITREIFLTGYKNEVVPIINSPTKSNAELYLPPSSFIHISDFANAKKLAAYIKKVESDPKEMGRLFAWKSVGALKVARHLVLRRACNMLLPIIQGENKKRQSIEDINSYLADNKCNKKP